MAPETNQIGNSAENTPKPVREWRDGVHPSAWVGPGVELTENVVIAPGAVVGFSSPDGGSEPVLIGENTWVGPHVYIEPGVEIGADCRIGPFTLIKTGAKIGRRVRIYQHCSIMGPCEIRDDVVVLADAYVCEHSVLEPSCQIMPYALLFNDTYPPTAIVVKGPVVGECAVVGAGAQIWPGVRLGKHSLVASMSEVKSDVPDYILVRGSPARQVCDVREIRFKDGQRWIFPYPWPRHLIDGEDVSQPSPYPKVRRPRPPGRFGSL
jgi:acetyltransferase-like isoleucine patch superfamily enzyme